MNLTAAQLATLKADILADGTLNAFPNTSDGNFAIAALYNIAASPDWTVWRTDTPIDNIQDAIIYANMTPAQATDQPNALQCAQWLNRAELCQAKQFNLQNLLLGRDRVNAAKPNIRAGFQDALTGLPSKNDGTTQAAGWTAVQTAMQRLATRFEKLFSAGTGSPASPATMVVEGAIDGNTITNARN